MPLHGERRREYERQRREKWRKEIIRLAGGACVVCGATAHLEFHHRDPKEKGYKISQMMNMSSMSLILEMAKCELRCARHHRDAHTTEMQHGTRAGYQRGCRCLACVSAKREYIREWLKQYRADGRDKTRRNYKGK